jgi:hypothetical protein
VEIKASNRHCAPMRKKPVLRVRSTDVLFAYIPRMDPVRSSRPRRSSG